MEKQTIIIGDVHGLTYWKEVVKDNPNCKYVFLGDYLDPYQPIRRKALIRNLKEIIQLKKKHPDNVLLLLGNHDLHYFTSDMEPSSRFDFDIAEVASDLFLENIDLFQYAHQGANTVFTHAGIAHKWFTDDFKGDLNRNIADQLNNPTPEQIPALCRCGQCRGGDWGMVGGIFWADIKELCEPLQGYTQIVGHNCVEDVKEHTKDGGRIIFCDCLFNEHYLKIETPQYYMRIRLTTNSCRHRGGRARRKRWKGTAALMVPCWFAQGYGKLQSISRRRNLFPPFLVLLRIVWEDVLCVPLGTLYW